MQTDAPAPPSAPAPDDLTRLRDRLLLAALPEVAFDGWSQAALKRAAQEVGCGPLDLAQAFPGGALDMVAHFSDWADRAMLARMAADDVPTLKVRERVALALRSRLQAMTPYREAAQRAAGLLALPSNAALAARLLHQTVDLAWYAAGDDAVDFNHYTKRLLLSGVAAATQLYWLGDGSDDQADSWAFLDRRIADAMSLGRAAAKLKPSDAPLPDIGGHVARLASLLPSPARFWRHLRQH